MAELPYTWNAVLNALLDGPVGWKSPAQVAEAVGGDVSATTDVLCDLDLGGWLSVQETESGVHVALSALGAERLGVRLGEFGPRAIPRWMRVDEPEPPAPIATHVCRGARAAALDFVVDPAPPLEEFADRAQRAAAFAGAPVVPQAPKPRVEDFPKPSRLIGSGLIPWPGPAQACDVVCPACGGRTLGPEMYCLYCDRWGLDTLAPTVPIPKPGRHRMREDRQALERLAVEHQRARRKEKRQMRNLAAIEAERRRKNEPKNESKTTPRNPQFSATSKPASASAAR